MLKHCITGALLLAVGAVVPPARRASDRQTYMKWNHDRCDSMYGPSVWPQSAGEVDRFCLLMTRAPIQTGYMLILCIHHQICVLSIVRIF